MSGEYLGILLFIAPGFVCRGIYEYLNGGGREEESFRLALSSLLCSVWILLLNYAMLYPAFHFQTFSGLLVLFDNILFILCYLLITIISCIVVAVIWNFIHPSLTMRFINFVRKKQGKCEIAETPLWDVFLKDKRNTVAIIRNEGRIIAKGMITRFSSAYNRRKELVIIPSDLVKDDYPAEDLKGVYVDCDNKLVIQIVHERCV